MAMPMSYSDHVLSRRIAETLFLPPDSPAIEYDQVWRTWGELGAAAWRIRGFVTAHPVGRRQIGILLHNRPEQVAALLGVLLGGGTVVVINPSRGEDRTRADITASHLPLIIGAPDDLAHLVTPAPGSATLAITDLGADPHLSTTAGRGHHSGTAQSGVAVRMLTSGTTGPPKRIDITYDMLARSVIGRDPESTPAPARPRSGVAIVNAPLVHIGGLFRILQCITEARPFVLLPRFQLEPWARAVRTHRPKAVSLVPAAVRAVLHSDLTSDDLSSIRVVTSGTAPLSAEDADAFHEKFGIPILTTYAATEFGGGVAGWTLADHRKYWDAKRGSVGRASGGARLRVVDEDGTVLPPDRPGLLEVAPGQLGPSADWMRTTDLARIDDDGFLWILGRADQAIIRGGFKIMPDDVRNALERHPDVAGAAVVSRPDARLGEVPVAMVELRDSRTVTEADLSSYLRDRLAPYEIPAEIEIVPEIPRTPSGKADLTAVRGRLDESLHARSSERR